MPDHEASSNQSRLPRSPVVWAILGVLILMLLAIVLFALLPNTQAPQVGAGSAPVAGNAPAVYTAPPPPGTKVEVLWKGQWFYAMVLRNDGRKSWVHYDSYDDSDNEWVTPDRMRPRP